nr:hypothetical protein [Actinomycetota bacterium]
MFTVEGQWVFDVVDNQAPSDVLDSFYERIVALLDGPYPTDDPFTILPFKDGGDLADAYTAPFYRGLVVYEVSETRMRITLLDVLWI